MCRLWLSKYKGRTGSCFAASSYFQSGQENQGKREITGVVIKFHSLNDTDQLWFVQKQVHEAAQSHQLYFTDYSLLYRLSGEEFLLINTLSGAVDFIRGSSPERIAEIIHRRTKDRCIIRMREYLIRRGYLFTHERYERLARSRVASWYAKGSESYLFLIMLTTKCNFACTYCYERDLLYKDKGTTMSDEQLRAAIDAIRDRTRKESIPASKVLVQLFGGEPLLETNRNMVEHVFERAAKAGWKVGITTNGYTIVEYLPLLKRYKQQIGSILVTLDGPERIHNRRRTLRAGRTKNTFRRIARGIDDLVNNNIPCILNIAIDAQNHKHLPALYRYIVRRGWCAAPCFTVLHTRVTSFVNERKGSLSAEDLTSLHKMRHGKIQRVQFETGSKFTRYINSVLFPERDMGSQGNLLPKLTGCEPGCMGTFLGDSKMYQCSVLASAQKVPLYCYYPEMIPYDRNVKRLKKISAQGLEMCRCCKMAFFCGGPCPARYYLSDMPVNKVFCPGEDGVAAEIVNYLGDNRKALLKYLATLKKPQLIVNIS